MRLSHTSAATAVVFDDPNQFDELRAAIICLSSARLPAAQIRPQALDDSANEYSRDEYSNKPRVRRKEYFFSGP
jgi:hypothetical protein